MARPKYVSNTESLANFISLYRKGIALTFFLLLLVVGTAIAKKESANLILVLTLPLAALAGYAYILSRSTVGTVGIYAKMASGVVVSIFASLFLGVMVSVIDIDWLYSWTITNIFIIGLIFILPIPVTYYYGLFQGRKKFKSMRELAENGHISSNYFLHVLMGRVTGGNRAFAITAVWISIGALGVLAYWYGGDIKILVASLCMLVAWPSLLGALLGQYVALQEFLRDGDLLIS